MKKTTTKKSVGTKATTKAKSACATKKAASKAAVKSVTFTLHADKGKTVCLAGEFNKWDPAALKMKYKEGSGVYAVSLKLAAGTYQYKFVVNGTWCADPENVNAVANDQGTYNSVIEVK